VKSSGITLLHSTNGPLRLRPTGHNMLILIQISAAAISNYALWGRGLGGRAIVSICLRLGAAPSWWVARESEAAVVCSLLRW
jgi:hypothetical protein